MLVVLLILAVAGATVVPELATHRRSGARAAAHEVASLLRDARSRALTRGGTHTVTLNPRTGAWTVFRKTPADGLQRELAGTLSLGDAILRLDGPGDGLLTAVFDVRGRGWAPSLAVVDGAENYAVGVDPWTGEVSVGKR